MTSGDLADNLKKKNKAASDMFKKDQLVELLEGIGGRIDATVTVYLIGGCNLSLKGKKDATKDIDMVLTSKGDFLRMKAAVESLGFRQKDEEFAEPVYKAAVIVFEDDERSRIDLFVKRVAGALVLSSGMVGRSAFYGGFGKLRVMLVSDEDLFLFKSIAGRSDDINDCFALYAGGLDWDIIVDECVSQHREDVRWIFWLYELLCRMELQKMIVVPEKRRVFGICRSNWDRRPRDFMAEFPAEQVRRLVPVKYRKDVLGGRKTG